MFWLGLGLMGGMGCRAPAATADDSGVVDVPTVDSGATADSADTAGTVDSGDTADSAAVTSTDTMDSADTGDTAQPTDTDAGLSSWCGDFESGQLNDVGHLGANVTLGDGAVLANVAEGDDFSALTADRGIALNGDHALLMRSSQAGQIASVAIATTPVLRVTSPELLWFQLSEVSDKGLVFAVDVLTPESTVLASAILPVETGGHVPGLLDEADAIEGLPEIVVGAGVTGVLVGQAIDLSPWEGQDVKVRFYQHTLSEGNGFFTLVDDLCTGTADPRYSRVALGEPSDRW